VATASLAGLIAFPPDPIYTLTKHAVVGFVRSVAPQLQAKNITVNAICPGVVDTPLVGDAGAMLREAGFPMIEPSEIAAAVLMAATGTATGQAYACQAGAEPVAYEFREVPGPRRGEQRDWSAITRS
jgi:NAD(P)-dependent dehydrogenase (short-subunit alcohol dehydrogenase family)